MTYDPDRPLDMPFAEQSETSIPTDDMLVSSGVVVMASVADVHGHGTVPAVVFRFADGAGGFYPPMCLVMLGKTAELLPGLVSDAVTTAVRHAG